MSVNPSLPTKPSRWWMAAAAAALTIGVIAALGAFVLHRESSRPIGEGRLFLTDAQRAGTYVADAVDSGQGLESTVRHIRNELTVEAVAILDAEGALLAATSSTLSGTTVENGLLRFGLSNARLAAVAAPTPVDVAIDGVVEWNAGDILYQVAYPVDEGVNILLFYDISELLERRANTGGVNQQSIRLAFSAGVLALVALGMLIGRSRAMTRYREIHREAALLRDHARELEASNVSLEAAREQAERALALAEEKMRIRAEFVLMINHELRTPLTSVVTGAEMLQTEDADLTDGDKQRILDDIVCDGARLQNIIAQMLSVARIENRGLDFELRPVPLLETCATIENTHPRIKIGHAEGVDQGLLAALFLKTDPVVLGNLVASLCDNAFTHGATEVVVACTPDPGLIPDLQVGMVPEHAVYFTIADNGPGIDLEFLPRAFHKFEKKSFSSGTGLGLYIARLLVEALDGGICVTTSPKGTTMAIAIPMLEPSAQSVAA